MHAIETNGEKKTSLYFTSEGERENAYQNAYFW